MTKIGEFSECASPVDRAYPDSMLEWPEPQRKSALAARDALLQENPGRRVIEEISYCIGRDHPRFPQDEPARYTHALVFQIYLDGEADPSYRWDAAAHDWEPA